MSDSIEIPKDHISKIITRFARAALVNKSLFIGSEVVVSYGLNDVGQQLKMETSDGENSVHVFVPNEHSESVLVISNIHARGLISEFKASGHIVEKPGEWIATDSGERDFHVHDGGGISFIQCNPLLTSFVRTECRNMIADFAANIPK